MSGFQMKIIIAVVLLSVLGGWVKYTFHLRESKLKAEISLKQTRDNLDLAINRAAQEMKHAKDTDAKMAEIRIVREKERAVLKDAGRLERLAAARSDTITRLARAATVKLYRDFESIAGRAADLHRSPERGSTEHGAVSADSDED